MNFNVEGHLAAVERSVSSLEREGRPARAVTLSRSYATTVEDLWDAVTNGERLPCWFLPVSGELEPGGRYQLEGNAGGVITACERPSRLALTWEFGGDVSWVEVGLCGRRGPRCMAHPHAHRAPVGTLGRLRARRSRRGLGSGSPGTRDASCEPDRAETGRDCLCHFTGRQSVHRRKQRRMGASGGRGRNGPGRCARRGKAHDRVLYGRIARGDRNGEVSLHFRPRGAGQNQFQLGLD